MSGEFSPDFFLLFLPYFFTFYSCLFIFPVLYYRLRLKKPWSPKPLDGKVEEISPVFREPYTGC